MAKTKGNYWASGGLPAMVRKKTEKREPYKVLAEELRKQGKIKNPEIELIARAYIDLRKMLAKENPEWSDSKLDIETSAALKRVIKLPR